MTSTNLGQVIGALKVIGCKSASAYESLGNILPSIDSMLDKAGISDKETWWKHAIAQGGHESVLFSRLEENLWYSSSRLVEVWPKHFKTIEMALPYSGNPEKLGERIYGIENKSLSKTLGNTKPGDGWKFRGRSYMMLTGKYNYIECDKDLKLGLVDNPDLAKQPENSWLILTWYMTKSKVLAHIRNDDVYGVSLAVNGGTIGLSDRKDLTRKVENYFKSTKSVVPRVALATLKLGSYGQDVIKLQQLLWDRGFPCGKIDGDFGINTHRAVKAFQSANKLVSDGIVGAKTWLSLEPKYEVGK